MLSIEPREIRKADCFSGNRPIQLNRLRLKYVFEQKIGQPK